jgi:hypothetical protein
MLRTGILILLALLMAVVAIVTWGSIGSAVMVLCLLLMGGALAYQRFLTNRDEDLWQSE